MGYDIQIHFKKGFLNLKCPNKPWFRGHFEWPRRNSSWLRRKKTAGKTAKLKENLFGKKTSDFMIHTWKQNIINTYLPLLTFGKPPKYPPHLVNVVCERPLMCLLTCALWPCINIWCHVNLVCNPSWYILHRAFQNVHHGGFILLKIQESLPRLHT